MSAYQVPYRKKILIFLIAVLISAPLKIFWFDGDAVAAEIQQNNDGQMAVADPANSSPPMLSNLGNLDRLDAALAEHSVKIAVVGDSIAQGDADGLYENSIVATLMRLARQQNPDITFTFANFSLAGRGMATYSDSGYKGIGGPNDNPEKGFYREAGTEITRQWPGGSVQGKSWADHIKDFGPDLVIYAFGANDLSGISSLNAYYYLKSLDYQNTWSKVPSVAIATAALPTLSFGYQEQVQVAADAARGVARSRKITILDINRIFNIHRSAVDVDDIEYVQDESFKDYPSGWSKEAGATLAVFGSDTEYNLSGQGAVMRDKQSKDINISAAFTMPKWSAQTGGIRYRSLGAGLTQYTAQVTANQVLLYWGGTIIGTSSVYSAIPDGASATLQVVVTGARHEVFLNGNKVISLYDYNNLRFGEFGLVVSGGDGTISNWVANLGVPKQRGIPDMSDIQIYGVKDFAANPSGPGGNAINHPTKTANSVIWGASLDPLLYHIRTQARGAAPAPIQANQ